MPKFWVSYMFFLSLLIACSGNKGDNNSFISTEKEFPINNFVPEYLAKIPQINLSPKSYYRHGVENYVIDGLVDSMNLKQGYWKIHDFKNNIKYQGSYINNQLVGWWEVLSDSILICAGNYEHSRKQGYWSYHKIGENKTSKYVNYKDDTLFGLVAEFSSDSVLLATGYYANGLKNGYWKYYSATGLIKEQGDYHENYKSGWWKKYDDNGIMEYEASYSRDEIAGYVIKYINGKKSEEGQQFNGKKWGIWKYYDQYGNPYKIEEFYDY